MSSINGKRLSQNKMINNSYLLISGMANDRTESHNQYDMDF